MADKGGDRIMELKNRSQYLDKLISVQDMEVIKVVTGIRRCGKSSLLKNVTSGYHYHTIDAESEEILDAIQEELHQKGLLAKLQDYEPVDFWGGQE